MKKLLIIALVAIVVLTGCSTGTNSTGNNGAAGPAAPSENTNTKTAAGDNSDNSSTKNTAENNQTDSSIPANSDDDTVPVKELDLNKLQDNISNYLKDRFTYSFNDIENESKQEAIEKKYFSFATQQANYEDYGYGSADYAVLEDSTEVVAGQPTVKLYMQNELAYQNTTNPSEIPGIAFVNFQANRKLKDGSTMKVSYMGALGFKELLPDAGVVLTSHKVNSVLSMDLSQSDRDAITTGLKNALAEQLGGKNLDVIFMTKEMPDSVFVYDTYNDNSGRPQYAMHVIVSKGGSWAVQYEEDPITNDLKHKF